MKCNLILALLLVFNASGFVTNKLFAQDWWDYIVNDGVIPNDLSDTLVVLKLEKGTVFRSDFGVKRANKKMERIFNRYYPYPFVMASRSEISPDDSSLYFGTQEYNKSFTYTDATGMKTNKYNTNRYYFFRNNPGSQYSYFNYFSQFKFHTLRLLLQGVRVNVAGKKEANIIKVNLLSTWFKIYNMSYERGITRNFSAKIDVYGNKYSHEYTTYVLNTPTGTSTYDATFTAVEPGVRYYLSLSPAYARGFYFELSPAIYRLHRYYNSSQNENTRWSFGITPAIGVQHYILKNIVVSYRWGFPFQYDTSWGLSDHTTQGTIQLGFRF